MNNPGHRHARENSQEPSRRRSNRVRAAVAVAVIAALGAIPAAQAATGGASSYEPAPTATATGEEIAFGPMRYAGASWYGPGLWGRGTACGVILRPTTVGVAHKALPCGTMVRFVYHGRTVTAPVIDRGPYVKGRSWDLTAAASEALRFEGVGVGRVGYQVAVEYARRG
jgi:rare lipoprotein A (peptidoglycan hydrolase)